MLKNDFVMRFFGCFQLPVGVVGAERSIQLSYGRRSAESHLRGMVSNMLTAPFWCIAYSTTFFCLGKALFQKSRRKPLLRGLRHGFVSGAPSAE